MLWLNKAKDFLAAIAAKDQDFFEQCLDPDVEFIAEGDCVRGKTMLINSLLSLPIRTKIQINNSAYNDKYIFLEYSLINENGKRNDNVMTVEFKHDKIIRVREY